MSFSERSILNLDSFCAHPEYPGQDRFLTYNQKSIFRSDSGKDVHLQDVTSI
jgi:hypothetical protein